MKKNDTAKSYNVAAFLLRHGKGELRWFILAIGASFISIAASFLMPQVIRFTVDSIIGSEEQTLSPFITNILALLGGAEGLRRNLFWCAIGVVLLSVLSGAFNFLSRMGIATGTERFSRNLRDTLFQHVQYLPFKWHVENQTGEIIQRCTSDLDVVRNFISGQLLEVTRTIMLITIALALMFSMNWKLTLVALFFIPVIIGYSILFYRLVGDRFLKADVAEGELTTAVQENLTGVRVVRAFGREKYELERFDNYNQNYANLWLRLGKVLALYWSVGDIATGLQIFSVIIAGTVMAVQGELTLGAFLVFVTYNQMLAWPVRGLGRTLSTMSQTGVSAQRIQEILDAPQETEEPEALKPNLNTDIRFENVTFSYESQQVLKDLNFTIPKGTTFGILGSTGSGKSTITYLLNRLYELPEGFGNIWFGDVEIRQIDRYYLRHKVGLVLQEPFLFSKSIEENISIASKNAEPEAVRLASGIASLDDAVSEFAGGYDTMVGERGLTLSGGQKQRVAIARTLMLKAPVMVFDDSMSAVDLETDARIREALRKNTKDTTVILISHRINTLMQADQIMVLEDGRVTHLGTHRELIHTPGLYQRIYEAQSKAGEENLPSSPIDGTAHKGGIQV